MQAALLILAEKCVFKHISKKKKTFSADLAMKCMNTL